MGTEVLSQLWVAWQPIVDLTTGNLIGHEALVRGPVDSPLAMPAELFAWADRGGHAQELELACRRLALDAASQEWPTDQRLFLNVDGRWPRLPEPFERRTVPAVPLAVEISERHSTLDNPRLLEALARWRHAGHWLVVDDYGTGYAAAATVLAIQPDIVKVDRQLIAGLDHDHQKRSFFAMFRGWTEDLGCRLVAEGIETAEELAALRDLGCDYGQGFWLGRPSPTLQGPVALPERTMPTRRAPATDLVHPVLAFYGSAIAQSTIPSYVVDRRRRLVAWNDAAANLLGYGREHMEGHLCFTSPLDHRSREDARLCVAACPLVLAMAQRQIESSVVSARTRSGERQVLSVSATPLVDSATGRVVGALEQFSALPSWPAAPASGPDLPEPGSSVAGRRLA
jgi:PAS domain S-box-containing protein